MIKHERGQSNKLHPNARASKYVHRAKMGRQRLFFKILAVTSSMFVFGSAVWMGVGGYYFSKLRHASDERDLMREIHLRLSDARDAERTFLLDSVHDAAFYDQGTNENVAKHRVAMAEARQEIERLNRVSPRSDVVEQLALRVNDYDESFEHLVDAYRTRGIDDRGLAGKLRNAIRALETDLSRLDQRALTIACLQLQRAASEYLLRHDPKDVEQIFHRFADLRTSIGTAGDIPFASRLDDVKTAFGHVLDADMRIGLTNEEGLCGETRRAARNLESIAERLVAESNDDLTGIHDRSAVLIALIMLSGGVMAVALSAFVSRTMTRPLAELQRVTERVAQGEFQIGVNVSTHDEIGDLARSFETMTETLNHVANMTEKIASGDYTDNADVGVPENRLCVSLTKITHTLRETTEENRSQAMELKIATEMQRRLRETLDASSDAVYLIDCERMQIVDMNATACTSTGYSRDTLLTMSPLDIVIEDAREASLRTLQAVERTGETPQGRDDAIETRCCRNDGSTFPAAVHLRALNSDDRTIVVATACDLTERKRYESKLNSLHRQLTDATEHSGKAEIATSVLHNVGNVLNSVNVSASLIQDAVRTSGVTSLVKAVEMIQQHSDDLGTFVTRDERGKYLPQFLIELSRKMATQDGQILDEIMSLIGNIHHIKTIIATQQLYARGIAGGVMEEVSLADLLENAIHVNTASMSRHAITIDRQLEDVGPVLMDKHKLLQIMVNLISNAKYACIESGNKTHRIAVRLQRTGEDRVSIEVQDNGMGIASENLTQIFAHGFTTRDEGHGFGLHSAALAAEELGGSLIADSDGPGTGATFTLEVPCKSAGALLCRN